MNIDEIKNTIAELEQGETSFSNCQKLANLYIVMQNLNKQDNYSVDKVITEYNDILPMYSKYCNIKQKFQLNEVTEKAVENAIDSVTKEIKEFIQILYSNTNSEYERNSISTMLIDLKALF